MITLVRTMHIYQYWHSKDIPNYISPLLYSFRYVNPSSQYMLFDQVAADRFITAHFSMRQVKAFRACAVPAMQADYFRYCAILASGGAYADADMLCIAELQPLLSERIRAGAIFRRPNQNIMNAFFLFRSPASLFLRLVLEIATANIENRLTEDVWLTTGPGLFTFLDLLHRAGSFEAFEEQEKYNEDKAVPAFANLMCRTIGDFEKVRQAFGQVEILSEAELDRYTILPSMHFPYKDTDVHWTKVKGSIFKPDLNQSHDKEG